MIKITEKQIGEYIEAEIADDPQIQKYLDLKEKKLLKGLDDFEEKEFEGCMRALRGNTYFWLQTKGFNTNDN